MAAVLEMYTLSFHHNGDPDISNSRIGVTPEDPFNSTVWYTPGKYRMSWLALPLLGSNGVISALPARQSIVMHLVYTDECP
jgi:hypothetical protein